METTEIEIERRFLLKYLPETEWDEIKKISQNYISEKGSDETERVRMVGGDTLLDSKFWHTIKTFNSEMVQNETERQIEIDEFGLLYKKANRFIAKNRHIKKHDMDDLKWEIDDMGRKLKLVIAEIEIPSEDYDLKIPEWLEPYVLLEITGMKQFSNSNLAE